MKPIASLSVGALIVALLGSSLLSSPPSVRAGSPDPQVATDHPWYPGELACSSFPRLFATQDAVFQRVTGRAVATDEDKALAAWLWRNTHYWHGEEGPSDLWGRGLAKSADNWTREYWLGLFAHGFALCGTTHAQWTAEMQYRLGHNTGRVVGTAGHNAFEVFLTGGPYGTGKWVLLDHDLSTVVADNTGKSLLSATEIAADWRRLTDRKRRTDSPWLVCGLHPSDGASYARVRSAEYFAGYAGPPPMVHLRRGETLRRYVRPGLADGRTFVFWGRNYNTAGVPGPERNLTWVNQPDKMFRSRTGAGGPAGQARFANAVFRYQPNFASDDYREGVVAEDAEQVTFSFRSPYIIAVTPPNDKPWGILDAGGRNGLVLSGSATCGVSLSLDHGKSWIDAGAFRDGLDLTDHVKGRSAYWIRFGAGARSLAGTGLTMTTVCQANSSVIPQLRSDGCRVELSASGRALVSAGPELPVARAHVVDGAFDSRTVTLELASPNGEPIRTVYAAAQVASSNPPDPKVRYAIDWSADGGKTWHPVVRDWSITRRGQEPDDFWSQSFVFGSVELPVEPPVGPPTAGHPTSVRVRFTNTGGKRFLRAEAHAAFAVARSDPVEVTFRWSEAGGAAKSAAHVFSGRPGESWTLPTGRDVTTHWVEYRPAP